MTNETLLLQLRAESMSSDLQRLKSRFKSVPDRRIDLNSLTAALTTAVDQIKKTRQDLIDLPVGGVQDKMDEIDHDLIAVRRNLTNALSAIENMKAKCFRVDESPIGSDYTAGLNTRTATAEQDIHRIKEMLKKSEPPDSIWKSLRETAASGSEPMFAEYVEFLGGVALRDTGFDEGISIVADELWKSHAPGGGKSNFIAIPARQQALQHTLARIIRVTFPDWTIWSLPATALEFWRVVVSVSIDATLKASLGNLSNEQKAKIDATCNEQLGDAYATYTMGPSYALLAISLMLDPAMDAHQNRVRAILYMLECMDNKEGDLNKPYRNVRRQLLQAWNAARRQFNRAPLGLDADEPSSADTQDSEGTGVRIVVGALWRILGNVTSSGFVVDVWNEVQKWIPHLLSGSVERIPIAAGAEMRHVLTAGWLARVSPERSLSVDELTKAVQQLRDRMLQKGV
jgi:hypothetical protein